MYNFVKVFRVDSFKKFIIKLENDWFLLCELLNVLKGYENKIYFIFS